MDKPTIDVLAERVERLEKECHRLNRLAGRWRAISTAGLIGLGVVLTAGAQRERTRVPAPEDDPREALFTKGVFLLPPDSNANAPKTPRASLRCDPNGNTSLTFFGPKLGEAGFSFGVDGKGQPFLGCSRKGRQMFQMTASDENGPSLSLFGKDKTELRLSVQGENTAGLQIFEPDGSRRLRLALTPDGSAALVCYDGEQRYRAGLGTESDGASSLRFADEARRDLIGFGVNASGLPRLYLRDREGQTLFQAPQP
jgi:hypothetical protein